MHVWVISILSKLITIEKSFLSFSFSFASFPTRHVRMKYVLYVSTFPFYDASRSQCIFSYTYIYCAMLWWHFGVISQNWSASVDRPNKKKKKKTSDSALQFQFTYISVWLDISSLFRRKEIIRFHSRFLPNGHDKLLSRTTTLPSYR